MTEKNSHSSGFHLESIMGEKGNRFCPPTWSWDEFVALSNNKLSLRLAGLGGNEEFRNRKKCFLLSFLFYPPLHCGDMAQSVVSCSTGANGANMSSIKCGLVCSQPSSPTYFTRVHKWVLPCQFQSWLYCCALFTNANWNSGDDGFQREMNPEKPAWRLTNNLTLWPGEAEEGFSFCRFPLKHRSNKLEITNHAHLVPLRRWKHRVIKV